MHPDCNKALWYYCKIIVAKQFNLLSCIQSVMFGVQIQHIAESPYFQLQWLLHHVMGIHAIVKDQGVFRIKRNGIEPNTVIILEENLVQSAFQQTLGDKFSFHQNNNLKHKAKCDQIQESRHMSQVTGELSKKICELSGTLISNLYAICNNTNKIVKLRAQLVQPQKK